MTSLPILIAGLGPAWHAAFLAAASAVWLVSLHRVLRDGMPGGQARTTRSRRR